ncbi:MAG: hypothetical protein LJE70_17855 [Chromatiaceae bacterium]|nr:hypothetical protein [Chromatiaceae bacterium]
MDEIDDPLLALILRFVVAEADSDLPHAACMRLQVTLIQEHISAFRAEDREARAIEWVEQHARRFREDCKGKLVAAALAEEARCRDCPLLETSNRGPCVIHEYWASLVRRYVNKQLSSAEYVRNSLALLQEHKEKLKVTGLREETPPPASV